MNAFRMSAAQLAAKGFVRVLFATLAVAALAAAYLGWAFWASLPRLDGYIRVAGIAGQVRIVRDIHGVAHVLGSNEADVSFGLGYAHAQDRFFQMDLMRRAGEGRLSELIGELGYEADVRARTRNWPALVRAQTASLPPSLQSALVAYTAGVNARLREGLASPEYAFLFARPKRWRIEDSIACGLALIADQTGSRTEEAWREVLRRRLSRQQLADFFPAYPAWGPTVLPGTGAHDGARGGEPSRAGSNAWVVSGAHTATDYPLMAADPHIGFSAPAAFYLARLATPQGDFVGATLPGAPFIVMGRGPAGAFSVTNGEIDAEDLVVVSQSAFDGARLRRETILVRGLLGTESRSIEIRDTAIGPIIDPHYFEEAEAFGASAHVVLRSAADDAENHAFEAFYLLSRAANADAVRDASQLMRAPALNLLFAGTDGSIGYALAGVLPMRNADGDWAADLPESERPSIVNPASGEIVSANNPPTAATAYRGYFMAERALRIAALLDRLPRHDTQDFAAMQRDEVSEVAIRFMHYVARATPRTERGRALQRALGLWDGGMDRQRREPLLYSAWLRELGPAIYGDEIGNENLSLFPRARVAFLLAVFEHDAAGWCDDNTTAAAESCSGAAGVALDRAAIEAPEGTWGDWHVARFEHPLMSRIPMLNSLYSVQQPVGGDSTTVNMTRLAGGSSYHSDFGAAYRAVYNLAQLDRSRYMLAPGQSGHPFSPYYRNLVRAWAAGETFEIRGRRDGEAPESAAHTLVLAPAHM